MLIFSVSQRILFSSRENSEQRKLKPEKHVQTKDLEARGAKRKQGGS